MMEKSSSTSKQQIDNSLASFKSNYFPDENWILRWVNRRILSSKNNASPRIEVTLCKVPRDLSFNSYQAYNDPIPTIKKILLPAGELPNLRLNNWYQNGKLILDDESNFVYHKVIANSKKEYSPFVKRKIFKANSLEGYFQLFEAFDEYGPVKVYIPAWEILRSMYTPTSHFARSILSYPGDIALDKLAVLNSCSTDPTIRNKWNIVLRNSVGQEWGKLVACLIFLSSANLAFKEIFFNTQISDGFIGARLPFENQEQELTIKIHKTKLTSSKQPREIYALQLIRAAWSDWDKIDLNFTSEYQKEKAHAKKTASPFSSGVSVAPENEVEVDISYDDPDTNASSSIYHLLSGKSAFVANNIDITKIKKSPSISFEKNSDIPNITTNIGSSGIHGEDIQGIGRISNDLKEQFDSNEFALLIQTMDNLKKEGKITTYTSIPPSSKYMYSLRNGLRVWAYPTKILTKNSKLKKIEVTVPFAWLDKEHKRIRTALILKIVVNSFELLWIETEFRNNIGVRSVLALGPRTDEEIYNICIKIAEKRGNLGPAYNMELFGNEFGKVWTWKHFKSEKKVNGKTVLTFHENSLLTQIFRGIT